MLKITCFCILFLCLASFTLAEKQQFTNKITSLLSMKTEASGAVESALKLLEDLKQANVKEQQDADNLNKTQEAEGLQEIADLTEIRNENQKTYSDAQAHTKFIQTELADTQQYLNWIEQRFTTIEAQRKLLEEERCHANFMFVKAIKEHRDAEKVIEFLKVDLAGYTSKGAVELSQIKEFSDKLSAYSHLFEQQQLDNFLEMGRDAHVDNTQAKLKLKEFDSAADERNIREGSLGDKIVQKLTELAEHLKVSLQNLEDNEVKASYDFATWLAHAQQEVQTLKGEKERKTEYLLKLQIELEVAQDTEEKCRFALEKSQAALDAAIAELNRKRAFYANETARRNDENSILDEVLAIFKEKVLSMSNQLSDRVEDYIPDKELEQSNIGKRNINQQVKKDSGNLKENVAAEAAY